MKKTVPDTLVLGTQKFTADLILQEILILEKLLVNIKPSGSHEIWLELSSDQF